MNWCQFKLGEWQLESGVVPVQAPPADMFGGSFGFGTGIVVLAAKWPDPGPLSRGDHWINFTGSTPSGTIVKMVPLTKWDLSKNHFEVVPLQSGPILKWFNELVPHGTTWQVGPEWDHHQESCCICGFHHGNPDKLPSSSQFRLEEKSFPNLLFRLRPVASWYFELGPVQGTSSSWDKLPTGFELVPVQTGSSSNCVIELGPVQAGISCKLDLTWSQFELVPVGKFFIWGFDTQTVRSEEEKGSRDEVVMRTREELKKERNEERNLVSPHRTFFFPGFQVYSLDRPADLISLMRSSCRSDYAPRGGSLTIVNVYCPAGFQSPSILHNVLVNASHQFLVVGDFNSHHTTWGLKTDACGRELWNWICLRNLSLANDGSPTFLRGTTRSVLDLTLCSPSQTSLALLLDECVGLPAVDRASRATDALSRSIVTATFHLERHSSSNCAPWWSEECTRAYRRRKAAWKQVLSNTSHANWKNYQFLKAVFKRTISAAKQVFYNSRNSFLSHPKRRKALYKHIAYIRRSFSSASCNELSVAPDDVAKARLEAVAERLSLRFRNAVPRGPPFPQASPSGFFPVTEEELDAVVRSLPRSAPGPDGITSAMVKSLWASHPHELLNIANVSVEHAWIPGVWKIARVAVIKKVPSRGLEIDNVRPIALTSVLCKTTERVLHRRLESYLEASSVLNDSQIRFRPRCSIWMAHVNLESQIRHARETGNISALVALDVAKAYDSVEHSVLLHIMASVRVPPYIISWVDSFLTGRSFFCSDGRFTSSQQAQHRGVPQGSVLSPLLFNILMSSLPFDQNILTITYANDIAFFASSPSLHLLYEKLQVYLNALSAWMRSVHLSLNVQKCAVLLFTPSRYPSSPVTTDLKGASGSIRQTNLLKYLGDWYEGHLDWAHHLEVVSQKATKACSLLHRCSSTRIGMRRNALLLVYKCYIRPVLEFGCVLFSHLPDYRLRRLFIIERKALRHCLGLPKYTSNQALYCEARILPLKSRFRVLPINTFLSLCQSPLSLRHNGALRDMRYWLDRRWRKSNTPQLVFAELLLKPLGVSLTDVPPPCYPLFCPSVKIEDVFQPGTSFTDHNKLEVILNRHIDRFPEHLVVATVASVSGQRAGVGLVFPRLDGHFPIRLPDYIPVFESEFLAIVLALRMVPARNCKTLLLSDSLSVITSLANPSSPLLQLLASLTPPHISEIVLTWIPGHKGLTLNEAADSLAKISLTEPTQTTRKVPRMSWRSHQVPKIRMSR
ncbi:uncharacterized protein LOC135384474 [Ornithodoros turicata]|uniref:uncharacterized protein LOC135384474 n=1 Tax=Ornithodoros turicata TaxID=34597 RepID=UPI003138DDAB